MIDSMAVLLSNIALRSASLSAESSSLIWRLTLYLTALSVSLATSAFVLQWRGGLQAPDIIDNYSFPETSLSSTLSSADCAQILGRSKEPSFPYYSWRPTSRSGPSHNALKLCVVTTTTAGLEEILPWIFYHKIIGITHFFLFVEGKAASNNVALVLESIPEVKLIHRTLEELEEHKATSRVWYETDMPHYLNKPCNYELYVKQSLNMEMAVGMAREAGMDWIIHIDTDELLHPAGTMNYSLQELLSEVPSNVDFVRFPNYESCVERDDIKEPFSEVTMFKKNYFHLSNETFYKYPDVRFLTYENWKSAARVQVGVLPLGAHQWYSHRKKRTNETMFQEAAILHYTYTKFSDLTSRGNRCRCKPTREDVERCFMMKFDRKAFIISSTSTEEEMLYWYYEHVVWYDTKLNAELLQAGVFERIYTPMMIVQGLKESDIFADVIASAWQKQASQKSSSQTAAGEPTGGNKSQSALEIQ